MQYNSDNLMLETISTAPIKKENEPEDDVKTQCKKAFQDKVIQYNTLACNNRLENIDERAKAYAESENNIIALDAQGGLQEMLIAQMTSIHLLQQRTIALANRTGLIDPKQHLINSAIKLANCFTQQAALLAKLQGINGQKIIVEHVEVHHGGQAVVGNIEGGVPLRETKYENKPMHRS